MKSAEKLKKLQIDVQEIQRDCESLAHLDSRMVTPGEKRAWLSIARQLAAAVKTSKSVS
jgi:hypothetical protein